MATPADPDRTAPIMMDLHGGRHRHRAAEPAPAATVLAPDLSRAAATDAPAGGRSDTDRVWAGLVLMGMLIVVAMLACVVLIR